MQRFLCGAGGLALLCGCTDAGFAQNARVVSASSAAVDAEGEDAYRWIDRARALWDTIGDAPPDYSFGFDGGSPVAWETRDGYWVVVEERPEGARTYFFAPGERGPFLVREADRSFGFQDGNVAAVYDGGGTLLSSYDGARWLGEGERLYQRGRRVRSALLDRQWSPVDTTSWADLNLFFVGIDSGWDSGWRYRNDGYALAEQRRWAEERARRAAMAAAFAQWRNGGFQGPPPPGLGHRWQHRPPRPGSPPYGAQPPRPPRPPVAGQPAPPRPGDGRPGRPWMWGGLPGGQGGVRPDRPHGGTRPTPIPPGTVPGAPPPGTVPGTQPPAAGAPGQPPAAGAPGWHGWGPGGPRRPRPDGSVGRPPRPDGDGPGRPGWQGPRPGWQGPRPGWQGPRPGWQGGRPGGAAPQPGSPPGTAPAAPPPPAGAQGEPPRRGGGWMSPGWARQGRIDAGGGAAPAPAPARPAPPPPAPHVAPAARPAPPPRPEARSVSPAVRGRMEARSE
ncbi:hypothetical protein [Sphingomonas sp. TDK1]|uniref:hypothetical protein n=1 Tax=Sphingomonas sp. TDK1 TaxID=453247 RepID=UPI0012EDEDF0|nr:hypothetical protein [Sphingomonas sp. TDK1]